MGQFKSLYQDKNLASSNDIYHAINSIGFPIVESNQMDNDNSDDEGAVWSMSDYYYIYLELPLTTGN